MAHDDDYDDDGTDQDTGGRNPLREQLRKQEKELKALREQLTAGQQATRELAFVKAGVDPQDKKAAYFVKGYDGDLTPEAIKKAAEDAGFLDAPNVDVVTDEEKAGLAEIDRATSRGTTPGRRDIGAEMQALLNRTDLTLPQRQAELNKLAAEGGVSVLQ